MDTTTVIQASDFTSVLESLTSQVSVASIVGVLGVAAGAAVGLAFMWWGVRKLTGVLMKAFKKGKVSL